MIPLPSLGQQTVTSGAEIGGGQVPNKSHDLLLKKSPFAKIPSFLSTYSRFRGSLITTPGGSEGTSIWKVSNPNLRSHFTNQEKSLWRAWRKRIPFPTNGSLFGGCLYGSRHQPNFNSMRIILEIREKNQFNDQTGNHYGEHGQATA